MLVLLSLLLQAATGIDSCAPVPLLPAYAHNDYRNHRPLLDALAQGYRGVEADVYRVGTELLVGHERSEVRAANTLTRLYLEPLRQRQQACGHVLADRAPFFLNVELKESDSAAFSLLLAELAKYPELLEEVKVTLVGWWPSFAGGGAIWPDYLKRQVVVKRNGPLTTPADWRSIGLVSIDYGKVLRWRGWGDVPAADRARLTEARELATRLGVPLRVHHVPVNALIYRWLLAEQVTLLGSTDLERSRALFEH